MPTSRPRPTPRGMQRLLAGYLATLLAVACGLPAAIIGIIAANQCHGEGLHCLAYLVYGWIAAALIAVVALPLLARRFGLGLWFALLVIALVLSPLALGGGSIFAGTAFLGPGLAAWVSEPIEPDPSTVDPLGPAPEPTSQPRHWRIRIGLTLVASVLIPCLGRVI